MNISDAKKKDLILEYIIKRYNGSPPESASDEDIKKDLLPNEPIEDIAILLKEIEMHNPELVKFYFGITSICVTEIMFAKPFLKNGGFQRLEHKEKKQNRKEDYDFIVSKFKYYTFWWFFAFAFFGFGLSVYNFIKDRENGKDAEIENKNKVQKELVIKKAQTSISIQKNHRSEVHKILTDTVK